jgi:hypothetical protein
MDIRSPVGSEGEHLLEKRTVLSGRGANYDHERSLAGGLRGVP